MIKPSVCSQSLFFSLVFANTSVISHIHILMILNIIYVLKVPNSGSNLSVQDISSFVTVRHLI